ncbi:hypothetical protein BC829DRAFT_396136 [Chytridium lagenaria]|nr:hypothetical protein BC829DRAFT_396136 [Chytridium lagenaria]
MTEWSWNSSDEGFEPISQGSAIRKRIVKEGNGDGIVKALKLLVRSPSMFNYTGYVWPDGPKFDSSYDRKRPFRFRIGTGEVIEAWDEGIIGMKIGEHSQLICPPELAYGKLGNPPTIPPNATLIFEIEVVKFDPPEDPISVKLSDAKAAKEEGNLYFKSGDFAQAVAAYQRGVDRMEYTWGAEPSEAIESKAVRLALNLNLAAASLKTKDPKIAVAAAERAILLDGKSVKAYFRLGQAKADLALWEDAYQAMDKAAMLDPRDAAIPKERQRIENLEKEVMIKEKNLYKKMFS